MSKQSDREAFIAQLNRALPDLPFGHVNRAARLLMRHAVTHGHIQERWCNEEMSDRTTARVEKREAQLEARMAAICAEIGLVADFGGDPRGYTVKVHLPNGAYNTWGGKESGYGVPQ